MEDDDFDIEDDFLQDIPSTTYVYQPPKPAISKTFSEEGPSLTSSSDRKKANVRFSDDVLKNPEAISTNTMDSLKISTPTTSLFDSNPEGSKSTEFFGSSLSTTKRRRGGDRSKMSLPDPLGLFTSTSLDVEVKDSNAEKKPVRKEPDLPDWLSGSPVKRRESEIQLDEKKGGSEEKKGIPTKEVKEIIVQTAIKDGKYDAGKEVETPKVEEKNLKQLDMPIDPLAMFQHQDSQILLAMQIKKLEDKINLLEIKQTKLLDLNEKQIEETHKNRQDDIKQRLNAQQERINQYVADILSNKETRVNDVTEETNEGTVNKTKIKEAIEKYTEYFELVEESYRKQIAVLEDNQKATEERLKNEIVNLNMFYEKKMRKSEARNDDIERINKEKIEEIYSEHRLEIERLRDNHEKLIENLRNEYMALIDRIKQNQTIEHNFKLSKPINIMLDETLEKLEKNTINLQEAQLSLKTHINTEIEQRNKEIKRKETELTLTSNQITKQKEIYEKDHARLMGLIDSLEQRLVEQTVASKEIQWQAQQREAKLAARETAFEREVQHMRDMNTRELQQIETMKLAIINEHEKLSQQINDDRLKLAAEQAKLQTSSLFKNNFNEEKVRIQLESALDVAHKQTQEALSERETLAVERQKLEEEAETLKLWEAKLTQKEKDIKHLFEKCQQRNEEANQIYAEAKAIEDRYIGKHKHLQVQMASLRVRERKLIEQKIAVAREQQRSHHVQQYSKEQHHHVDQDKANCPVCYVDDIPVSHEYVKENLVDEDVNVD